MPSRKDIEPFLDKGYRDSYLDIFVRSGIALQIQALRDQLQLSQADFGKLIGKTQSFVSHIEDTDYSGTVKVLLDIAKALNIGLDIRFRSYDYLLDADVSGNAFKVMDVYETYHTGAPDVVTAHISLPSPSTSLAPVFALPIDIGATTLSISDGVTYFSGIVEINTELGYVGNVGSLISEDESRWPNRLPPSSQGKFHESETPNSGRSIQM